MTAKNLDDLFNVVMLQHTEYYKAASPRESRPIKLAQGGVKVEYVSNLFVQKESLMVKAALLVPLTDNTGKRFPKELFRELEFKLRENFSGFTDTGVVRGQWVDAGRIYEDISRRYEIAIEETQIEVLRQLALWVKNSFKQKAVYLEIQMGTLVEIIRE